jgi:hypothetical protein
MHAQNPMKIESEVKLPNELQLCRDALMVKPFVASAENPHGLRFDPVRASR